MRSRGLLRTAKAHLLSFDKVHRPIVVMGLRRGGTTMVANAIAINKGVWNADEPFALFPSRPALEAKRKMLPTREHSQYFDLDPAELEAFSNYVEHLFRARPPLAGSCARPRRLLRADRVSLKVLNAPWMIDWFMDETDAHVLPLVRHPGAQAISVLRQKWGFAVEAYWNRVHRIEDRFTVAQRDLMEDILKGSDTWSIAVLDYAVLSKMFFERHRRKLIRYEDIVTDPMKFVDEVLIAQCGLEERELMRRTFASPSASSMMSLDRLNKAIASGDTATVLNMWRKKVTPDMQRVGQRILDTFEIDAYSFYDQEPT